MFLPDTADRTTAHLSRRQCLQQMGRWAAWGWALGVGASALAACQRRSLAASHPLQGVHLADVQGQAQDGVALLGWRPVLINCWATWCPPCVQELPLLDQAWRQLQAGPDAQRPFDMLALALDSADAVRRFWLQHDFALPLAIASAADMGRLRDLGNTRGSLPYSVLLGPDGAILHSHFGAFQPETWTDFLQQAHALLEKSKQ